MAFESKSEKEYPLFLRIDNKKLISSGSRIRLDLKTFLKKECSIPFLKKQQWNVQKASEIMVWFDQICTVHGLMDQHYRDFTIDLSMKALQVHFN